ncbi:HipA domain-containing protein [Gracilibacillus sp. YIM 98692]|uniref:HipA domain-containing protein n=1 Tax=Gracilibacillus sp. YIM 98692 TaxID=2663532 RepID=UPI0013D7FE95|nr:HipA domain-containing protein [Gracilibacillus sp. YIM 98692]
MSLIDVSSWEVDEKRQVSGTREKYWLVHPETEQRFLFKIPKENTGEAWAEKIASEVGKAMGLSTMDVNLAKRNNTVAVLAANFINKQEELFEGGDLFFTIADDFDRYNLKYYDFFNIMKVLSEFQLERDFIKIPVFDAFIGNQDRHCDNWGIIDSKSGYKIAPIYDSGASLGFQLKEDRINLMFQDPNMFKAFSNRSFSLIGLPNKKKPRFLDLLDVIKQHYPSEVKETIHLINKVNENLLEGIMESIPEEVMGVTYKKWAKKLLLYRKEWLLDWYRGGV